MKHIQVEKKYKEVDSDELIVQRIDFHLEKINMSWTDLARKSNIPISTLRSKRNRKYSFNTEDLSKIAKTLSIDPSTLINQNNFEVTTKMRSRNV